MRWAVLCAIIMVPLSAQAADTTRSTTGTVLLSDPATGQTVGKWDGQPLILKKTGSGTTIGKIGSDKVLIHQDDQGNSLSRIGNRRMFCHSDRATGVLLCKE